MARTTFSGPVTSNAGFNSDDTLNSADLALGAYNLTDFTVRPAATYTGTVAALVGAVNQRTAGVSGGNMFGCYAQTSFSNNPERETPLFMAWLTVVLAHLLEPLMEQCLILLNLQEQEHQDQRRL